MDICTYAHIYMHWCACAYMHFIIYAHVRVCIYAHVCTYIYVHMHVYAHMYMYICTCLHIRINTYALVCTSNNFKQITRIIYKSKPWLFKALNISLLIIDSKNQFNSLCMTPKLLIQNTIYEYFFQFKKMKVKNYH